jgi:hypothetical protein
MSRIGVGFTATKGIRPGTGTAHVIAAIRACAE